MQIGTWLTQHHYIAPAQLDEALDRQRQWNAPLGEILLATRAITPLVWLEALKAQSLDAINLQHTPADSTLLNANDLPHYTAHRFVPHHETPSALLIATPAPTETLLAWCEAHYGRPCALLLITARDHHQYLQTHFSAHLTDHAKQHLLSHQPALSAYTSTTKQQRRGIALALASLAACFLLAPHATWNGLVIAVSLFYITTLAFKTLLLFSVPPQLRRHRQWQASARALRDEELPTYSLLIPLYHEPPSVIRQNLAAIDALDYPKTKLDVWLIAEADDEATLNALREAAPADYCRILRVPPSQPRTKPKACNIALPLLRGEFTVIYDAEDIPDPMQLKLAVAAFRSSRPKTACMQAALNYYNRDENLLTRLFAIEYSALFNLFLPALRFLSIPIPLGGTSNHIRTATLREIGGWDPYNVTEDADLGIRLSYYGYRTDILPSLTLEESPITLRAWLNQRSRWIKGYVQTWLVYMRHPRKLFTQIGPVAFFGFQLFVGAPALTFLLAPFFWVLSLLLLTGLTPALHLPGWLLACCAATFTLGIAIQWLTASRALAREPWGNMRDALVIFPFYWLLHSLACIKALWQLIRRPHFWEKTSHGKSRIFMQKPAS